MSGEKYDVKREHRALYAPAPGTFTLVDVPALRYLAVAGAGDPNTAASYAEALGALYPAAYALKFASKRLLDRDYVVPPLEGLWWSPDPGSFTRRDKEAWRWTLLLHLPSWLEEEFCAATLTALAARRELPGLARLHRLALTEGRCVQTLHVGSYDDEGPTLARLHQHFLPEHGLVHNGHHHEIYLSDPRRTAPPKLRTILRQPVRALSS